MKTKPLPNSVTVQYSELMQNCIHPLSDGSNISFKSKVINRKRYWYLYISLGQIILDSGMGFFQVPALNRKQAFTSFKIRGRASLPGSPRDPARGYCTCVRCRKSQGREVC